MTDTTTPATDRARPRLTKAETIALWHAVDDMALMHREAMRCDDISDEAKESSAARLKAARAALRKVNAIRRAATRLIPPNSMELDSSKAMLAQEKTS